MKLKNSLAAVLFVASGIGSTLAFPVAAEARSSGMCQWTGMDWDEMSSTVRSAWVTLGWSRERWEAGIPPASDNKDWADLSTPQRRAAHALGATESSWDNSSC